MAHKNINKLSAAEKERIRKARVKNEKADRFGGTVRDFFGIKNPDSRTAAEKRADLARRARKKKS